jgi:hypothetical protein
MSTLYNDHEQFAYKYKTHLIFCWILEIIKYGSLDCLYKFKETLLACSSKHISGHDKSHSPTPWASEIDQIYIRDSKFSDKNTHKRASDILAS